MKKTFLLIGIWIMAINVNSQGYNELIQQNKFWDICSYDNWAPFYNSIYKIFFTGTDTVLDGKVYSISKQYSYMALDSGNLRPPFVIDTNAFLTGSFIREDTVLRQVFIYQPNMNPTDQLLFDFSLGVGDTLQSEFNAVYGNYLVVTSIDSVILLNGEVRRRLNLQEPLFLFDGFYIEGIGGPQGIFLPILETFEQEYHYRYFCVSHNDINLWGDECNWYFVGTKNISEQLEIKVYPNPAQEKIVIEIDMKAPECILNLYATNGKLVKTKRLHSPKSEVILDGLIPGIYIVQIVSESNIYNGKLTIFN